MDNFLTMLAISLLLVLLVGTISKKYNDYSQGKEAEKLCAPYAVKAVYSSQDKYYAVCGNDVIKEFVEEKGRQE